MGFDQYTKINMTAGSGSGRESSSRQSSIGAGEMSHACKSDIKGQKEAFRSKLDYFWNLIEKQKERNSQKSNKHRFIKNKDVLNAIKESNGQYKIFGKEKENYRPKEKLIIHEGVLIIRKVQEDERYETTVKRGGGKKSKLTTFSKKSRLNMMKTLGMLKYTPEFWFDLTYPDDVMEGLTLEERRNRSSEDIHQLKRSLEREGIKMHGAWKREWKVRLSGILIGSAVPHYHIVVWVENEDTNKYLRIHNLIVEKWLNIIGTKGDYEEKARKVHYNKKSRRFIESQKQVRKYMQKYISKIEELITDESIGRSWGLFGDPIEKNPEEIEIANNEMVLLKRMLRKLCKRINKKVKYGINFCLSHEFTQFFVLMEKQTIYRMLEQIRAGTAIEGVPF
jgi:hypothetical protein